MMQYRFAKDECKNTSQRGVGGRYEQHRRHCTGVAVLPPINKILTDSLEKAIKISGTGKRENFSLLHSFRG